MADLKSEGISLYRPPGRGGKRSPYWRAQVRPKGGGRFRYFNPGNVTDKSEALAAVRKYQATLKPEPVPEKKPRKKARPSPVQRLENELKPAAPPSTPPADPAGSVSPPGEVGPVGAGVFASAPVPADPVTPAVPPPAAAEDLRAVLGLPPAPNAPQPVSPTPTMAIAPVESEGQRMVYSMAATGVTYMFEAGLQWSVRKAGREPAELGEREGKLIESGLGELFRSWFGPTELTPGKQVLAGVIVGGIGMWSGGKPIKPIEAAEEPPQQDEAPKDGGEAAA